MPIKHNAHQVSRNLKIVIGDVQEKLGRNMQIAAFWLAQKYRDALGVSGDTSSPGEMPSAKTGEGAQGAIVVTVLSPTRVQISPAPGFEYLWFLDRGIRARKITATNGAALKIPLTWLEERGLDPGSVDGAKFIDGEWVIFRNEVLVGPVAPRPWVRPIWLANKDEFLRIVKRGI